MTPIGLYLHIPFCLQRCAYCDFNTYLMDEPLAGRYVEALLQEIAAEGASRAAEHAAAGGTVIGGRLPIATLFLGGGTPSILPPGALERIMIAVRRAFALDPDAEITLEANPGTLTREALETVRAAGYNRLSMGVQSFDAGLLQLLTRVHSPEEAIRGVAWARAAGFENISIDLMFALPTQTLAQWRDTLQQAMALETDHLSLYGLILEEGTPMHRWVREGALTLPGEDVDADMETLAVDLLEQAGFHRYEISNFATPGRACRHNQIYWRNEPYLGLGAGAYSGWGGRRFGKVKRPAEYVAGVARGESLVRDEEAQDEPLQMGETAMLALRTDEGIRFDAFRARFHRGAEEVFREPMERYQREGLLKVGQEGIVLTRRGWSLASPVMADFLEAARQAGEKSASR